MRADFLRTDDGSEVVATASWNGRRVVVESDDDDTRRAVRRIFRPIPVVVEDAAYRSLGANGESVIQPGSIEWFRAAAYARAGSEGLTARIVPEVDGPGGWDPAAAYRSFRQDMTRIIEQGIRPDAPRDAE